MKEGGRDGILDLDTKYNGKKDQKDWRGLFRRYSEGRERVKKRESPVSCELV